jgi:K+-transporting ATPase ATPase C chain
MLKQLRPAIISVLVFTGLCGIVFPFVITPIAQLIFPHQANGSLIMQKGQVVGSALIGQNFSKPEYFHPRPSAAGNGYDAANSSGSNLGPTSQKLADQIRDRVQAYRTENDLPPDAQVPADAVTASGSGLDPHISPANAELQATRVARARAISLSEVHRLIEQCTDGRQFVILGDPGVNVLKLNLALDRINS